MRCAGEKHRTRPSASHRLLPLRLLQQHFMVAAAVTLLDQLTVGADTGRRLVSSAYFGQVVPASSATGKFCITEMQTAAKAAIPPKAS